MAPSTIILITGANSGVGFASTKVIASSSDKYHVIVAGRTLEKAQKAVADLKATGQLKGTISALQLDHNDIASVERAAKAVEQQFGRLDVLVNNGAIAGVKGEDGNFAGPAGLSDSDFVNSFREVLVTNVVGPYTVSRIFRPLLQRSADPRVVYVSSGMGSISQTPGRREVYRPFGENGIPYGVSKAALNMVSVIEKTVVDSKAKIFLFCPGFVVSRLRGESEEAQSGWGGAGDPEVSGHTLLTIIEGKRDEDEGKGTLHKDGVYPW